MDQTNKISLSDDEEDLEALRLAALQTLKKNSATSQHLPTSQKAKSSRNEAEPSFRLGNRKHGHFCNKRGRFHAGRGTKNGQFHSSRAVSSNLIPLTPSIPKEEMRSRHAEESSNSTITLPQDRYNNSKPQKETKLDEISTKFDRYKDHNKSEEEDSEDEALKSESDDDSPSKLERSDSLEALMKELDDEIQGKSSIKEKEEKPAKAKTKIKKKKDVVKQEVEQEEKDASKPELSTDSQEVPKDPVQIVSEEKNERVPQDQVQIVSEKINEPSPPPEKSDKSDKVDISKPISQKNVSGEEENRDRTPEGEPVLKKRRYSPMQKDVPSFRDKPLHRRRSPILHPHQFLPDGGPLPFPPNNAPPMFMNPPFGPPNLIMNAPPFYERPLSPLLINAETLQTQTMAPLSPRSAAFVLENRAIIEKRKRSPRRSYSRSPSPRRRSLSASRSPTPLRRRSLSPRKRSLSPRMRSISPRRRSTSPRKRSTSPLRKWSRSPKRPVSPKRRSPSPRRRSPSPKRRNFSPKLRPLSPKSKPFSPKRRSPSPKRRSLSPRRRDRKDPVDNSVKTKPSIRERLGFKASAKPDEKDKDKPSSDSNSQKDDKPLDPVLEARKKKFETKEIKIREGVIRLKPKEDVKLEHTDTSLESETPEQINTEVLEKKTDQTKQAPEENVNEDALLEDDELDLEAQVDLFSDDDTGSENEGRFKAKQLTGENPAVLPFTKLINGTSKEIKTRRLSESNARKVRERSRSPRNRSKEVTNKKNADSRNAPTDSASRKNSRVSLDKTMARRKLGVKTERHPKRFERKIEIKIKNPSKYERADRVDGEKETRAEKDKGGRKVELGDVTGSIDVEDEDETEIVVENDEDEVENTVSNEGDLRAQLSKKRAEKLQKTSTTRDAVTSRLLQNALQNALPMKKSKKSKSKELTSSDGKLPIHLRLGLSCSTDVFTKTKRKSKKRKNVETEDQV